jgi:hypothetical protein
MAAEREMARRCRAADPKDAAGAGRRQPFAGNKILKGANGVPSAFFSGGGPLAASITPVFGHFLISLVG